MNLNKLQELYNILIMKQELLCQQQVNMEDNYAEIEAIKVKIKIEEEALGVCNSLERSIKCIECNCWKIDNKW